MTAIRTLFDEEIYKLNSHSFIQELQGGDITNVKYGTFLYNLHPQYNFLENVAVNHECLSCRIGPGIWADMKEVLAENTTMPQQIDASLKTLREFSINRDAPPNIVAYCYVYHKIVFTLAQTFIVPGSNTAFTFTEQEIEFQLENLESFANHPLGLWDDNSLLKPVANGINLIKQTFDQMAEL